MKKDCLHFLLWLTVNYWTVKQQMLLLCCKLFQNVLRLSYKCVGITVWCQDGWELYWDFWKRYAFSGVFFFLFFEIAGRNISGEEKNKNPFLETFLAAPQTLQHSRFQKATFIFNPSNVYGNTSICSAVLCPIIIVVFVTKFKMCYWSGFRWLRG